MVILMKYFGFFLLLTTGLMAGPAVDQFGNKHELINTSGYTVLDFAASWCKPCWKALPHLQEFANANPNIKVVVVSVDDTENGRDMLVKKLKLTMPVVWDEGHKIAETYNPPGMPTTMILDKDGKIVYSHVGFSTGKWAKFRETLKNLTSP